MDVEEEQREELPREWHKSTSFNEAFGHAWSGLQLSFRTERNLKVQVAIYVLVLLLAVALKLSFLAMALILVVATLIIVLELINTAIENFADIVKPSYHETVRQVKDVMAGAVLLASLLAVIVGFLLFGPLFLAWFV